MPLIPENNENIACVINLSPASKGRVEEKMPVGEDGPSKRLCSQSLKDIINRSSDRTQVPFVEHCLNAPRNLVDDVNQILKEQIPAQTEHIALLEQSFLARQAETEGRFNEKMDIFWNTLVENKNTIEKLTRELDDSKKTIEKLTLQIDVLSANKPGAKRLYVSYKIRDFLG
ncbi:hypothetical protein CYMTET_46269 [Cymbomonas tetramitiformis]|uniref:Uncharacterized protein n=1 Tax=Cymbomonas tetramitiformis TaxID=36881 RepID=A0AAE0EYV3_9CHLO|nr:hypothetical protein CYMTET_46269 [Cymbomonas tetramitiformis]